MHGLFQLMTSAFGRSMCDIPAQGLKGLIRILIPISSNFFPEAHHKKTPKLSVLRLERWVTDR
jgi:hypothetical protein